MADVKNENLGPIHRRILKQQITKAENNVLAQDQEELKKWTGDSLSLDDQRQKDASTLQDLSDDLLQQRRMRAIAQGSADQAKTGGTLAKDTFTLPVKVPWYRKLFG